MSNDTAARLVLSRFPAAGGAARLNALGNRGGFSGARLWHVEGTAGPLCLKAWPTAGPGPGRLSEIHGLMAAARAAGLAFVPTVFGTDEGKTCLEHAGRAWDLTAWMPGAADYHHSPSSSRLENACAALARVHNAWASFSRPAAPCPAVTQRLARAAEWQARFASGWLPPPHASPEAIKAAALLRRHLPAVAGTLAPWAQARLPSQPCLCDVWHDHVLFTGEEVSGLIDYGGVKPSHPSADLARLLGSFVGDDESGWHVGLAAYRRVRRLGDDEECLARALDRTGTVLALGGWLHWLHVEGKAFDDPVAAAARLATLVRRVESWER